jgi:hypothetical protein
MTKRHFASLLGTIVCGSAVALCCGCKRSDSSKVNSDADPQVVEAAQKLPGGTNVLSALDQKQYEEAVAAFGKMQESGGGEQRDVTILRRYVANKLAASSGDDPKAAEALHAFQILTMGR